MAIVKCSPAKLHSSERIPAASIRSWAATRPRVGHELVATATQLRNGTQRTFDSKAPAGGADAGEGTGEEIGVGGGEPEGPEPAHRVAADRGACGVQGEVPGRVSPDLERVGLGLLRVAAAE